MTEDKDTRGYTHPFDLGTGRRNLGLDAPHGHLHGLISGANPLWQLPEKQGAHSWVAKLAFSIPATLLGDSGIAVDPRRLAGIEVYCWVCERDLETREMAHGPCLGDPSDRYIPTREEFTGWPEERQLEWLDTLDGKASQ